jgi:hypothetical protein
VAKATIVERAAGNGLQLVLAQRARLVEPRSDVGAVGAQRLAKGQGVGHELEVGRVAPS